MKRIDGQALLRRELPVAVVEELRALGHDILTTQEAGKANQALPDTDVLTFAISQERAVLTLNRLHFMRLHRERPLHSGIVVCKFDPDFGAQAKRIHAAVGQAEPLAGKLLRVNRA